MLWKCYTQNVHFQSNAQNYLNQASTLCKWRASIVEAGFRQARETRDQNANIRWIIEKARKFQKTLYFCSIDHAKAFDCVDQNKLWKILKEMGIPDHLTCLLRNLYAGQEASVRTRHETMWKVVVESCEYTGILGPRRRRIQPGARDEAWSLRAFV